jgi:DNA-binding response OmpR family regulator
MVVNRDQNPHQLLDNALETEGFDTIVVTDADTALKQLEQVEPDLIILDSVAGEEETYQELQRIRRNSDVPIIILTARYEPEDLQKALSLGADDYVRKPFGTRSLVARVRAKLRRRYTGTALAG